ncbi:hypothetical protein [uncultured Nisaea sp.]|uniref:hypothetical protein n=1 Tax=uncultured Nisaea sp. TaxID=538215 RepID=UPI0030EF6E82|tara:strand:+ start:727 stop:2088 length:1362 start_codon:yes stop_codon:yes gene_type:complete
MRSPSTNRLALAICFILGTSSCSPDFATSNGWVDSRVTLVGANPVIETDKFAPIELADLLDPDNKANRGKEGDGTNKSDSSRLDRAFAAFYKYGNLRERRNRVQERILAAANQRCEIYKRYIQRVRSSSNFILGSAATAAGILGGLFTATATARSLSAASGILSGTRAEYNQEMFQNLATQVITAGIDKRRQDVYQQIVTKGQAFDIEKYSVEAAIKDTMTYEDMCSAYAAFEEANDSIKTVTDPGIEAANRVLAKLATTRKLMDMETDPQEAQTLVRESAQQLRAGKPEIEGQSPTASATYASSVKDVIEEAARISVALTDKRPKTNPDNALSLFRTEITSYQEEASKQLDTCKDPAFNADKAVAEQNIRIQSNTDSSTNDYLRNKMLELKAEALLVSRKIQTISDRITSQLKAVSDTLDGVESIGDAVLVAQTDYLKTINQNGGVVAFGKC